jgi:hypothetical protein
MATKTLSARLPGAMHMTRILLCPYPRAAFALVAKSNLLALHPFRHQGGDTSAPLSKNPTDIMSELWEGPSLEALMKSCNKELMYATEKHQ